MIKGTCSICGMKKNRFIKFSLESGFLNDAIGKLGNLDIALHLASEKSENVPNVFFNNLQNYLYVESGTKYLQRNREGYKGINELDEIAKLHDQFYNENLDTKYRNISDITLTHRANQIANNPPLTNLKEMRD